MIVTILNENYYTDKLDCFDDILFEGIHDIENGRTVSVYSFALGPFRSKLSVDNGVFEIGNSFNILGAFFAFCEEALFVYDNMCKTISRYFDQVLEAGV